MLPDPALKPEYDKIVWLYVYRDFSKNDADRAAERISIRFGVTSWPQMFLADPATMEILRHTGRKLESFQNAVKSTKVKRVAHEKDLERITAAEERAKKLEKRGDVKAARKGIDDKDIVVRTRALEVLEDKDPKLVAKRAKELLAVENDMFRYTVCAVLKEAGDVKAAPALEALVKDPKPSLNPNVLRIRAVQALSTCGTAKSADVVAPYASGSPNNGLTGISIDTLGELGARHKKARKRIDAILQDCYPPEPRDQRANALAARIDKARKKLK